MAADVTSHARISRRLLFSLLSFVHLPRVGAHGPAGPGVGVHQDAAPGTPHLSPWGAAQALPPLAAPVTPVPYHFQPPLIAMDVSSSTKMI